jgi:hypothetical protein
MLNVFSDSKLKPSEQIRELQMCAGSDYTRLLFAGSESEPLYILKPEMVNMLVWVNRRILFELPNVKNYENAQWIDVRIRIATNMLNKQVDAGVITKNIALVYHQRLTSRIRRILSSIYTEDLPF